MTTAEAFAPAKINLALHVTGRRADGYHLLDSLVVFADVGDRLRLEDGPLSLSVTGPEAAGVPDGPENLVLSAAALAGAKSGRLTLEKHLPAAAGIGGGSSDAAAALRLLADPPPGPEALLSLGADVPVCLSAGPVRMTGIGEGLAPVPALPDCAIVLVNPRVPVATPHVFAGLTHRDSPALPPLPATWGSLEQLIDWLETTNNDLEAPAQMLAPVIGDVLTELRNATGCQFARMSGSGATCVGLFADIAAANAAAETICMAQPGWWCVAALPGPGARRL